MVYIQYLQDHKLEVLAELTRIIQSFDGATLQDPDMSVTMTLNTKDSKAAMRKSRFSGLVNTEEWPETMAKQPPATVSFTKPAKKNSKPMLFSEAVMKGIDGGSSSSSESLDPYDSLSSSTNSRKSVREIRLERENSFLKSQIAKMNEHMQQMQKQLDAIMSAQLQQQQDPSPTVAKLSRTPQRTPSSQDAKRHKPLPVPPARPRGTSVGLSQFSQMQMDSPNERAFPTGQLKAPPETTPDQVGILDTTSLVHKQPAESLASNEAPDSNVQIDTSGTLDTGSRCNNPAGTNHGNGIE